MKNLEYSLKFERLLPWLVQTIDRLPRRHSIQVPADSNYEPPFFILGSGRNGSTLLAGMLTQHSRLHVPPEQWAMHEMILKYKFLNWRSWKPLSDQLLDVIRRPNKTSFWETDFESVRRILRNLPDQEQSLQRIFHEVFSEHGRQLNKSFERWGDQSPLTTVYLEYIYPVYPEASYIFLLRDGRDVVSSMVTNNNRDIRFATWKWLHSLDKYQWLKERGAPSQLHFLRYEDLVRNPQDELSRLCSFLGYDFEEAMLEFSHAVDQLGVEGLSHHQRLSQQLDTSSIGTWKERLNQQQKEYMLPRLEKQLEAFGYTD
ncbi:MAG: sulfotransferase family protein [Bacteroidota bacterium]